MIKNKETLEKAFLFLKNNLENGEKSVEKPLEVLQCYFKLRRVSLIQTLKELEKRGLILIVRSRITSTNRGAITRVVILRDKFPENW